jgi:hypothetical protein
MNVPGSAGGKIIEWNFNLLSGDPMRNAISTLALLCSVIVLNSFANTALAQDLPPDLTQALGLQFLTPGPKISRVEAREKLKELILKRLSKLQGWPGDYTSLKNNKAIAIQYDAPFPNPFIPRWYRPDYLEPHIGYWGGSWEYDSLEDAKTAAMQQCSRCTYCGKVACIPFLENDALVIPEQIINEYINARKLYVADEFKRFANSERTVLLDRASNALSSHQQSEWSKVLRVPTSESLTVGHPDSQQDYSEACQGRIIFPLVPIPRSSQATVLSRLQAILSTGTYDEYRRTVNTTLNYTQPRDGELWERMARFATKFEIDGDPVRLKKLNFPKYLFDALKRKRVQTVWLEGSVRVTKDGLPLTPSDYMAPLAVLADEVLYLGVFVRLPDDGEKCYVSKPFSRKVLDLSACKNNLSCAKRALDTLQQTLRSSFTASPFESSVITDEDFAPGEFGMKRIREPSRLLGAPAYEISTYTFQTWSADSDNPFYSLYLRQQFTGVDEERVKNPNGLYLFLKVTHVFTTSVHRNGTYVEPESDQVSRIERLVSASVRNAVEKTCSAIGGLMQSDVCKAHQISGELK